MGLEGRLKQLESRFNSRNILLEHSYDPDGVIKHLGFDPVALRESAHNTGKSVVETMCEIIGIEPREFERMLRGKAKLAR